MFIFSSTKLHRHADLKHGNQWFVHNAFQFYCRQHPWLARSCNEHVEAPQCDPTQSRASEPLILPRTDQSHAALPVAAALTVADLSVSESSLSVSKSPLPPVARHLARSAKATPSPSVANLLLVTDSDLHAARQVQRQRPRVEENAAAAEKFVSHSLPCRDSARSGVATAFAASSSVHLVNADEPEPLTRNGDDATSRTDEAPRPVSLLTSTLHAQAAAASMSSGAEADADVAASSSIALIINSTTVSVIPTYFPESSGGNQRPRSESRNAPAARTLPALESLKLDGIAVGHSPLSRLSVSSVSPSPTPSELAVEAERQRLVFELFEAAERGHVEIVQRLLESGVDVRSRGIDNWSILHFAARAGHTDVVEVALRAGGSVVINSLTKNLWTPLMIAISQGHAQLAQLLSSSGADLYIRNKQGHSAMDIAKQARTRRVLRQTFG